MNNALTAEDVSDLKAIVDGMPSRHGRRCLRVAELDDFGKRLVSFGFATVREGHLEPTEAAHVELEARGL